VNARANVNYDDSINYELHYGRDVLSDVNLYNAHYVTLYEIDAWEVVAKFRALPFYVI
jgi:hypothetical protein